MNESTGPTEDNTETTEAKEKTETSVPEEKTGAIEGETGAKVEEKSSNSFSEIVLKVLTNLSLKMCLESISKTEIRMPQF